MSIACVPPSLIVDGKLTEYGYSIAIYRQKEISKYITTQQQMSLRVLTQKLFQDYSGFTQSRNTEIITPFICASLYVYHQGTQIVGKRKKITFS